MMARDDEDRLLSILHAHGQQFLSSFDISIPKREVTDPRGSNSESEEEWTGLGSSVNRGNSDAASDDEQDSDSEQEDDNFIGSSSRTPDVMVFPDSVQKRREANLSTKELRKSFMSSKVSSVTSSTQPASKGKASDGNSDDERTNAQNDALLHRLVHTKLLSGSLNPELDLDHAQKGRALAGRVLELTGAAKLGKGESMVRQEQHNKSAKHVRDGLSRKQREREKLALEEARNLGNYHPTLKRVYGTKLPAQKKRRTRGLGPGVGKFVGGTLRLSQDEITSVTESRKRPQSDGHRGMRQRPR